MMCRFFTSEFLKDAYRNKTNFVINGTHKKVAAIAQKAFIYGYPLVLMNTTKDVSTNVVEPGMGRAPINQFAHQHSFPTPENTDVVSPNANTLYSIVWAKLNEPYVLHVPKISDRYFVVPILDAWTNVIQSIGTRTTGSDEQNFLIVGPTHAANRNADYGHPDFTVIHSPTDLVWILGRILVEPDNQKDLDFVASLQEQFTFVPLSQWPGDPKPEPGIINPDIPMDISPGQQVSAMNGEKFFNELSLLLVENPPAPDDKEIIDLMEEIGIKAGQPYSYAGMDPRYIAEIETGIRAAKQFINRDKNSWKVVHGWRVPPLKELGNFGTDYDTRATVALYGLGANLPADAIYVSAKVDSNGRLLSGDKEYVITFPKDQTPPVNAKGFWSLTLYNENYLFAENELNRYSLGDQHDLYYAEDGSLTLYIQHNDDNLEEETTKRNWLPSPEGHFVLMFRFYYPTPAILNQHNWQLPYVNVLSMPLLSRFACGMSC